MMSLQLHASPQITQILKVGILTKTQRQKISRFLHASLIPRDPQPNEKYQAVIPPSTQPLKVQDLSTVEASGPRGILLFGFDEKQAETVRTWLQTIEADLPIFSMQHSVTGLMTLAQALELIEQRRLGAMVADSALTYAAETDIQHQIVWFSGFLGVEQIGLIEAWEEFTGLERPYAGAGADGLEKRTISSLLSDILRANAQTDTDSSSKFTILGGESGETQAVGGEELRQQVQRAVERQLRAKKKKKKVDQEAERMFSLRAAKRGNDGNISKARGFK